MATAMESPLVAKPKAIVFTARGLTHDVQLQVFDQVYHVHSVILKMQSAFFFKFLDSPEKVNTIDQDGKITYNWVTEVDDDGKSWALIANSGKDAPKNKINFKGNEKKEIVAFGNVLAAMYGQPYSLDRLHGDAELQLMADLAEYYCALPAVSRSLDNVLIGKKFCISDHPDKWIMAAYKLRHAALFRECVVYLAGSWDLDSKEMVLPSDKKIEYIIASARARITTKIAEVHAKLLHESYEDETIRKPLINLMEANTACWLPDFYRQLHTNRFVYSHDREAVRDIFRPLIKNNLIFNYQNMLPGDIVYRSHFLCATVSDEELPWDNTKTDY